jgi:hypothetical protein
MFVTSGTDLFFQVKIVWQIHCLFYQILYKCHIIFVLFYFNFNYTYVLVCVYMFSQFCMKNSENKYLFFSHFLAWLEMKKKKKGLHFNNNSNVKKIHIVRPYFLHVVTRYVLTQVKPNNMSLPLTRHKWFFPIDLLFFLCFLIE